MKRTFNSVTVIGLGKVGKLVGILLHQSGFQVTGLDRQAFEDTPFPVEKGDVTDPSTLHSALKDQDAVVTCLPYHLNLAVAQAAHELGTHYFDLTEDVPTTEKVRNLSQTSKGVMVPQCGLAPGFIAIAGSNLTGGFEKLRSMELRVGALPQHPRGLLGYAFNWSPEGVVNEYLNDCEVIKDGQRAKVPPMESLETIVIDGVQLEAFSTSGGLGTLCETFDGKVSYLNYKTIRYPGHCRLMRFFFDELYMNENREMAGQILVNAKPPVNDDVVYVHAAVEGWQRGTLTRKEFVNSYFPKSISGQTWKAISWTTSASVCAVVEMVANNQLPQKGFLKQESIALEQFKESKNGSLYFSHLDIC